MVQGRDFPPAAQPVATGRLPLDQLITGRIPLVEVNSAFDDLVLGSGIRSGITQRVTRQRPRPIADLGSRSLVPAFAKGD